MKLKNRGSLFSPLFSIELHTDHPEDMVSFYEAVFNIKFKISTYPYPMYRSKVGQIAFLIAGPRASSCYSGKVKSGTCTFGALIEEGDSLGGEPYFLPPQRPLGNAWPKQYATRVMDPEGNHVALAASLESVVGQIPPIQTFRELFRCASELTSFRLSKYSKRLRFIRDYLLDRSQYRAGKVTVLNRNLAGYTYLVASREGLYAINDSEYRCILRGSFFGLTLKDGAIYCFQSCGGKLHAHTEASAFGRLLKINVEREVIVSIDVIAQGLDDGCHQIDFIGDDLVVVDCYNARLLVFKQGKGDYTAHYPLGKLSREVAMGVWHMNSFSVNPDGTIWLLLHNHNIVPSEIMILDRNFEQIRRFSIEAGGAHNIVFTNDADEYLVADSSGARVISSKRQITEIDMMRPRGIALGDDICAVGDSFFSSRPFRRYIPGRVHFFERSSWKHVGSISLPAAPTEIRRLDGKDYSISNYCVGSRSESRENAVEVSLC